MEENKHKQQTLNNKAKIKNKFVSPYPTDPVKIGRLKKIYWKFAVTFFLSFRSKFILLKIPYFRFVSPKDRYFRITEHIFVVKEKEKPTYLPTSKIVGRVRGNRNIFNCGPSDGKSSHCLWQGELKKRNKS